MKYRQLGGTGLSVSEIGFGAWGLGGDKGGSRAYGPVDDAESSRALRRALDLGVNFFDTSDFYGFGHSEEIIGRAFRGDRDRVIIASKAGMLDAEGRQDFSPARLRSSLEATLRRLGTDRLDLYQLHSPPVGLLLEKPEILGTLRDLAREGKIRACGVSLRSPDEGLKLLGAAVTGCVQVNFNLADQRARVNGLLDLCRSKGTGVIARTPLCFGFLTGLYTETSSLPGSDHRRRWSPAQVERWNQAAGLFAAALGLPGAQTPAQAALRFCLSYPGITSSIPGMLTAAQVEENAAASGLGPLTDEALIKVQELYGNGDFMEGPVRTGP
ncbi:MAG: oxidoreductase [Elusimicrobia bacterium]|nr:MAG: oxidoreductase [Elusimicrobiota bacterium]KAF0155547.1 MAG: oxidoreductase [Elusimicrobiota bacterium]